MLNQHHLPPVGQCERITDCSKEDHHLSHPTISDLLAGKQPAAKKEKTSNFWDFFWKKHTFGIVLAVISAGTTFSVSVYITKTFNRSMLLKEFSGPLEKGSGASYIIAETALRDYFDKEEWDSFMVEILVENMKVIISSSVGNQNADDAKKAAAKIETIFRQFPTKKPFWSVLSNQQSSKNILPYSTFIDKHAPVKSKLSEISKAIKANPDFGSKLESSKFFDVIVESAAKP